MITNIQSFYFFDATGRIVSAGGCPPDDLEAQRPPEGCGRGLGLADPASQYVSNGKVTSRPTLPAFDKTAVKVGEKAIISGLPNPTVVTVNGLSHTVSDGEFVLTGTSPGRFRIAVSAWPYLDYVEVITCA